jgi:ribosome-associated heat shock protein Hsp15
MRIDRLLCCLRFARTRSLAAKLVSKGHLRRNGERITRPSQDVSVGDILTIPIGKHVRLIEVATIPERRGPPRDARECYREIEREIGRGHMPQRN